MSSASTVPETSVLTGERAVATIGDTRFWPLVRDSIMRLRVADGFSHCRAVAFQAVLALIPGTIVLVAVASELRWETLSRAIVSTVERLAPGPTADVFRQAFDQAHQAGSARSGWTAFSVAVPALLVSGATAFGQVERTANRIYGIESDRPAARKYSLAAGLMCSAGVLMLLYLGVVGIGAHWFDSGSPWRTPWLAIRWPLGIGLLTGAVALVFKVSPRRRQPATSWLAVGGLISVVGCVAVSLLLSLYLHVSTGFGQTYGPLAGFIGVLLWAYLSSVALFLGLAFAAQLEAVRAGTPAPRDDRKVRDSDPDSVVVPYGTAAMDPHELTRSSG
jgi:YihY family inner membrane protein